LSLRFALCLRQQVLEVERAGEHCQRAFGCARPLLARTIPVEFDPVFVRIPEIKSLAHAVVRGTIERDARSPEASQGVRKFSARWIEDCEMIKAGRSWGRRGTAKALPGIEADVMMITTGRDKRSGAAKALREFKTEHSTIKAKRTFEIGNLQVHMPDRDAGMDRFDDRG